MFPDLCKAAIDSRTKKMCAYVMGKLQTDKATHQQYGHITALAVGGTHRRMGIARQLMDLFEQSCEAQGAFYVDLFVRANNQVAFKMYTEFGYNVYRQIKGYYTYDGKTSVPDDDAYGTFPQHLL